MALEPRMFVFPADAGAKARRRGMLNPIPASTNGSNEEKTDGWKPIDLADDQYATPPKPPDLHPLIYSGMRHALSGPPEATKTLLAYKILLEIASTGATVAIIDFEMGANRARILLDELGATQPQLWGILYYQDVTGPPGEQELGALAECALVTIDSSVGAFDASGLDDNARKDVEKWAKAWIRPLHQRGVATLVLDHVTKNADTRGKFQIGSERKTGGVDVHLGVEPVTALKRGGNSLVKIHTHKDRGAYLERPYACIVELSSDPETHTITVEMRPADSTDDEGHFRPTHLMEAVSIYLELAGEPRSRSNIVENVRGKTDYKRLAIDALVREGFAVETIGSRDAKNVKSEHPFREDDDPAPTPPHPAPGGVNYDPASPPPPLQGGGVGVSNAAGEETTPPRPEDEDEIDRLETLARSYLAEGDE